MPTYTVAAAALALQVDQKWLDNALSHHEVPHVAHAARGVSRKLATPAIELLAVAVALHRELQIPVSRALATAAQLLETGSAVLAPGITLSADIPAIRTQVAQATRSAMEVAPSIPRGRPPGSRGTGPQRRRAAKRGLNQEGV
jgi:hypothetical protein